MTEWRKLKAPEGDEPGLVEAVRVYNLEPGMAACYNEGDLHSPRRENTTRLVRIEGINLEGVGRDRYLPA